MVKRHIYSVGMNECPWERSVSAATAVKLKEIKLKMKDHSVVSNLSSGPDWTLCRADFSL